MCAAPELMAVTVLNGRLVVRSTIREVQAKLSGKGQISTP